jgi:hypothetical protein
MGGEIGAPPDSSLVSAGKKYGRHGKPNCRCGLEIDHKLEFGRSFNRNIRRI